MRDEISAYFSSSPPATASVGTARHSSSPHNDGWLPSPSPAMSAPALQGRCASAPRRSDVEGSRPAPEMRRAAGGTSPEETPRSLPIPGALPSTHPPCGALPALRCSPDPVRRIPGKDRRSDPGNAGPDTMPAVRPSSTRNYGTDDLELVQGSDHSPCRTLNRIGFLRHSQWCAVPRQVHRYAEGSIPKHRHYLSPVGGRTHKAVQEDYRGRPAVASDLVVQTIRQTHVV